MKICGLILAMVLGCTVAMAQGQGAASSSAPAATTQADGGITVWPKGVPPAGAARTSFENAAMMISHRTATGRVEVHQAVADFVVVQSGTATLVTGGEVVDQVTTGPNELGGSSIKGGVSRTVMAGDVYVIPPGVPHWYVLEPGGQITCLLIKVAKK
jgi:mannose-6-phosphate isomerase-like protein (cupin superfamily)